MCRLASPVREQHASHAIPYLNDGDDPVWNLYRDIVSRIGLRVTLIEWDSNLPDWPVLRAQALTVRQIMAEHGMSLSQEVSQQV
jgi:hypothetical protein